MNKEEAWLQITNKCPGLLDGKALTAKGNRAFFDAVWLAATNEAKRVNAISNSRPMPDFMRTIFGNGLN